MRVAIVGLLLLCLAGAAGSAPAAPLCAGGAPAPGYVKEVTRALTSGQDVWGDALLAAPGGPTYAGASSESRWRGRASRAPVPIVVRWV